MQNSKSALPTEISREIDLIPPLWTLRLCSRLGASAVFADGEFALKGGIAIDPEAASICIWWTYFFRIVRM
jgi:hypothetical protein